MPFQPTLGIVVVNYGSSALLSQNLAPLSDELAAGSDRSPVVVVVDNPTTTQERTEVKRMAADHGWIVEGPGTNLGFGAGANLGAARALADGADLLLVLNPDATIDSVSLARLVEVVVAAPMTLAGPVIRTSDGQVWFDGAGLDPQTGRIVGSADLGRPGIEPWLTGACLLISAQLWNLVDGFDDDYFLYWEDLDLSRRVREEGGELLVVPEATAVHDEGGTQGLTSTSRAKSTIYYYFNIRNRMLYADKFLTRAGRRRWLWHSLPEAWQVLLRGGRRQFLHDRSGLRAAATAVVDGARGVVGPRADPGAIRRDKASSGHGVVGRSDGPRLQVLQTYMAPLPFHNPYVKLHDRSLEDTGEAQVLHFDWRTALFGTYDVVHAHWPEDVLEATTRAKGWGKRGCMALWLILLRARGIPIVRTVHNLELPTGSDPIKRALLKAVDRQTAYRVLISETTPKPSGPHSVVLHGHYIEWLAENPRSERVDGRIAYFGLVRRYKNVEALARAFRNTCQDHPDWSLRISGKPSSDELVDALERLVCDDPRVGMTLRYLSDAEIVTTVSEATLVVLPYREMHNSGALLTALSLGRPVLVPDNAANRAVAAEVGSGWVHLYSGDLTARHLEDAMDAARGQLSSARPDLSRRAWDVSAAGHLAAYSAALAGAR